MSEEEQVVQEADSEAGQRFAIGITPFGHIGITITDTEGNSASYLINNPDEASKILTHLLSLTVMMVSSMYASHMQEQQLAQQLIQQQGKKVWTP